jgi:hypothetical protein
MFSFTNENSRKGEKIPFHPFCRSFIFVSEYYARPASSSNCLKKILVINLSLSPLVDDSSPRTDIELIKKTQK